MGHYLIPRNSLPGAQEQTSFQLGTSNIWKYIYYHGLGLRLLGCEIFFKQSKTLKELEVRKANWPRLHNPKDGCLKASDEDC